MKKKNEVDTLRTAVRTDGGDDSGRASADRGISGAAIETKLLTNWPTMQMTATWGN